MEHFSIDLETLGTRYNAPVISIGVQQFDPASGRMGGTFYREIDLDSAIRAGKVSGSTLAWWMTQSDAARQLFVDKPDKVPLATALDMLATWMRGMAPVPKVWGNGATFDITLLEHAYDTGCVGLREPWHFRNVRDMRTIVEAADLRQWPERGKGVHHHALNDATYQAQVISAAWQKCRGIVVPPGGKAKATPTPKRELLQANTDDDL